MTKEIFITIVENLKKSVAQDLQIDNALDSVGIFINRDNYIDYSGKPLMIFFIITLMTLLLK